MFSYIIAIIKLMVAYFYQNKWHGKQQHNKLHLVFNT